MLRHAVVLTAGLGTRLLPLTLVRAKPAIPVAGEPMVRRIIGWLVRHNVTDLVLNLHHLPHTLTASVGDGSDLGARVRYSWEQPVVLGSAGGPRHALPVVGADTFFLINGDTLTDLDLPALAAAHTASGALVTLALVPKRQPHRYGGVRLERDGRVTGFVRPTEPEPTDYHFIGVQVVHADAFRGLPDNEPLNSVGDVYDRLMRSRPGAIRGYVCDAAFWDVGTASDYWTTSLAFLGERADTQAYGRLVRIAPDARVTRSIVWDNVEIGAGCVIDECIITDNVDVPAGSMYRRAILLRGEREPLTTVLF